MIVLMGPRMLGVAVVQINFIVNTIIALSLPEGSVSAITLAFTVMLMPQAAIAQSVAIAAMPTFSAQVALGKLDELRASLAGSLRGVLLLAIPASLGLILLREPLIRLLYQNDTYFTAHSTQLVAWALLWYAAGLVGHSLLEVIVRAFYALHDTRTPVSVTVGGDDAERGLQLCLFGAVPAPGLDAARRAGAGQFAGDLARDAACCWPCCAAAWAGWKAGAAFSGAGPGGLRRAGDEARAAGLAAPGQRACRRACRIGCWFWAAPPWAGWSMPPSWPCCACPSWAWFGEPRNNSSIIKSGGFYERHSSPIFC